MVRLKRFVVIAAAIAPMLSQASVIGPDKIAARASYQPARFAEDHGSASPLWRKPTQTTHTRTDAGARPTEHNWRDPAFKPILWRYPAGR